ncbi:NAD(P)/FAD-dependent oxidoreductase [Jeotgalibacillus soli]|uniref:FAD dependent oxidoreductase domain-containing protein n=1 Tax=Jeotgalibacillus soli TaxID=889306 RepID=A0A0C2VYE4_9BACL|nr:FAD-dependent oxidoreductase [Jeotgalibacillus soli]KIL49431.1 hypothetical protein KP78_08990 [Jeotgalibacillus soli]
MDLSLHRGELYWPETVDEVPSYPALEQDLTCDVLIVGGGMAGALCAEALSHTPLKTVLVEKRTVGGGSSSANTGLLQYSNDKMLHEFIEELGEEKAVRFYKLCLQAVEDLQKTAGTFSMPAYFARRPSLYYASDDNDVSKLRKEYEALKKHGFEVEYLEKDRIKELFSFEKPAALLTHGDADVNPFQYIHGLMNLVHTRNVEIYENTSVKEAGIDKEYIYFSTDKGRIAAKKVIYSTGYETIPFAEKLGAELNRTYAIATTPVIDLTNWAYRALVWETKRPYFYMRTTEDGRIIAGGLDEDKMEAPVNKEIIKERGEQLLQRVKEHFPKYELEVSHTWSASFGESDDGLPFIGQHPDNEKIYYCLGFGGNGTVYSMLGAQILSDLIQGKENADAEIVRLDR